MSSPAVKAVGERATTGQAELRVHPALAIHRAALSDQSWVVAASLSLRRGAQPGDPLAAESRS